MLLQILIMLSLTASILIHSPRVQSETLKTAESIRLKYHQGLTQKGFASPLLKVKFDSKHSGIFLIDTGASSNVMASWFANKLPTNKKSEITIPDSTGQMMKAYLYHTQIQIQNLKIDNQTFLITDFPQEFEKNKIAGLVSPKSLGSFVALDFKRPQMMISESLDEIKNKFEIDFIPRSNQTTCLAPASSMYVVEVSIQKQKAKLLIDSGSATTKIFLSSPIGQILKSEAKKSPKQAAGLSGKKVDLLQLTNSSITFADKTQSTNVFLQDSQGKGCPGDGLMGLDLLKNCVLIMAKEDIGLSCN